MLTRAAGNTLIEMLIVIGIIGVICGAALPHFDTRRQDVHTTMRELLGPIGDRSSGSVPQHANGTWCGTGGDTKAGCNIYNPPVRQWDYDAGFNNAANLPPLTPRFVYVQQILFTENFK